MASSSSDWTCVPPTRKRNKIHPCLAKNPTTTPTYLRDATLGSITTEFTTRSKTWKSSSARQQLHRMLRLLQPDAGYQLETAAVLGTGSFNRDNFECRKRTMAQFAMFIDTLEFLQSLQPERRIEVWAQEGYYNQLDKEFLESLGVRMSEYETRTGDVVDCGPVTAKFGPRTFVCELFIEHGEGTVRGLTQSGCLLLVSTSRMMCKREWQSGRRFGKEDYARLLGAMDKAYRTMRFPHFEEDPNVFEGLDVLVTKIEDEDD